MTQQRARFFLGLDLDLKVCERLLLIQKELTPIIADQKGEARWVPPEQLHLTIKRLDGVEPDLLRRLTAAITEITARHEPFAIAARHVRAHPDGATPRIVFAQITDGLSPLKALVSDLDEGLEQVLGLPRDPRPFHARVTLGRVRTPTSRVDLSNVLAALTDLPLGQSLVRDVAIIESLLTPRGAQHQIRARAHLAGARDA